MPQLLKLRLVSVGHAQARMDDLLIDFQSPEGTAVDSTLWLRNGGGKSSILNLFFAIIRPHKSEFLGGKAEARQRSLNDYILPGDRAVTAAEWQLDPPINSLGIESERFITGVFYERRDGSGELRRFFFSCRVSTEHPESTIQGLPVYLSTHGNRTRRTLAAFREAWRSMRDRAPHLNVADTENQREWQEILEGARIDPELFSYQVRMNQREGGVDELFRFAEPEDFVDFLLALALDPALGDRVGRNIMAFRRKLLQRKEQFLPEQQLVSGLLERMAGMEEIRARRGELRVRLGEVREDVSHLRAAAGKRFRELQDRNDQAEMECRTWTTAAEEHETQEINKRTRAAHLRRHAAGLRLKLLKDEHEQAQEEWRSAQHLARVWNAAVPLHRALRFEEQARVQRQLIEERMNEHAPLLQELTQTAGIYSGALGWEIKKRQRQVENALTAEKRSYAEARDYRRQASEAAQLQGRAKAEIHHFEERLNQTESKRSRLIIDKLLESEEGPESGLDRWAAIVRDREEAAARIAGEITQIDGALETLEDVIRSAMKALGDCRLQREKITDRFEQAMKERAVVEANLVVRAVLELESLNADRLGADAFGALEQAARAAQRTIVETRLAAADDDRAALHLEEQGLLPPSSDVQRVLEFLRDRLAGQAWSGWSWIEANVPKEAARDAVRRAPLAAQGIVVRPGDLDRAAELLEKHGVEPDGPVLLADTENFHGRTGLGGRIVGPRESAWFDRDIARTRLKDLQNRLEEHRLRIFSAESQHRDLVHSLETLRVFRSKYTQGWFEASRREIAVAEVREQEAREHVEGLEEDRRVRQSNRRQLEAQIRDLQTELRVAREAKQRLQAFIEDYERPSGAWRTQLENAGERAVRAGEEAGQWTEMAETSERQARSSSVVAQRYGEEARLLEKELAGLRYIKGDIRAEPGPLEELRDRYSLLRDRYEERVGADALMALARQNDDHAKEERARLNKLLSSEITEEIVQKRLSEIAETETTEQMREEAVSRAGSLQGRIGNLKARLEPATQALRQAEEACRLFPIPGPTIERVPSTPELAEAEGTILENEATIHQHEAKADRKKADELRQRIEVLRGRRAELERHIERLEAIREDYADLLITGTVPSLPRPPVALEDSMLFQQLKKIAEILRTGRSEWQGLDAQRSSSVTTIRTFLGSPVFERLDTTWHRRIQEHDEPALEEASRQFLEQLGLRRSVLEDQIAGVDRHRTVLIDELQAVAEEGMKLLRQASNLSRLPEYVSGLGGAQFLRIQTEEPEDPNERRARLADLIDDLLGGNQGIGGVGLVQAAVRRLGRPIQVKVLHPDPALNRRSLTIPEMARSSGGEQLTGAILLYCTLAQVRARSRGLSRRASSVLLLDNPIGRASRVRFLELQRDVARAMGVQLIYTTGVNDHEALRALPNIIRLRNERIDRNSGRRLVEHSADGVGLIEAVRVGRREDPDYRKG